MCDIPEGEEGAFEDGGGKAAPPILANVVRAGSSLSNSGGGGKGSGGTGTPGEMKVSGEATTIFKDMVDALGDSQAQLPPTPTPPQPLPLCAPPRAFSRPARPPLPPSPQARARM